MTFSKNGVALAVLIIEAILTSLGVEFDAGTTEKAVEGIVVAMGLLLAIWNQVDRFDTKWFLFKK
jgi:hypothetical protein